jgi:hypothetical protein
MVQVGVLADFFSGCLTRRAVLEMAERLTVAFGCVVTATGTVSVLGADFMPNPSSSSAATRLSRSRAVLPPRTTAINRRPSFTADAARLKPEALTNPVFKPSMPS